MPHSFSRRALLAGGLCLPAARALAFGDSARFIPAVAQHNGRWDTRASGLLKPGGTLIYSTCSLEPHENGEVTHAFLEEQRNFELARERQLLPFTDGVDGAYVAVLRRVEKRRDT